MYGKVLTAADKAAHDSDMGDRITVAAIRSGMRCVVRIRTDFGKDFGLEYGGVIRYHDDGIFLVTRRHCDDSLWKLPLVFGSRNMLMSTRLPAYPAHTRPSPGTKGGTIVFLATPAFPERAIGYVLSEEYAALPIGDDDVLPDQEA